MDRREWRMAAAREDLEVFERVDEGQLNDLVEAIKEAKTVFVAGWGRAGLHGKILSMNLSQIGIPTYIVSDTGICTPAIHEGDLLVVSSNSGSTRTIAVLAEMAKEHGAKLALVSSNADSTIGKMADVNVVIPVQADLKRNTGWWSFYHVCTQVMDTVREYLMHDMGKTIDDILYYHNNME
ncbi:MAG: SIS domain-containing protein [Propionicimonas sp.]|uniref:SIS domain-containing protein n=1 Tax=Propionicimonas sp. TaxID=1955623 RepID=UPI002B1FA8CA|nr:SIS domain-containing protein [Propionicimonas sp.]MEA4945462.1 SIS domain-containing protein [Propionicimonas sp.]